MTIFNHFKHGVDVTKFKADQLLRINRIQSEIDGLRPKISEMHIRIANTAYELHQQGKLMNSELVELCAAIDDINRQMAEKESLINAIREEQPPQGVQTSAQATNICPNCRNPFSKGTLFCMHCGSPLPKTCPQCGTLITENARFCTSCGFNLDSPDQASGDA
jgi:rRNA maturation endonuclease Nob1